MDMISIRRKLMSLTERTPDLPVGYKRCVYLENPTIVSQTDPANFKYFDTGINPDLTHELVIKFAMLDHTSTNGIMSAPSGYAYGGANGLCYYYDSSRCSFGTHDLGYGSLMPTVDGRETVIRYSWKDKYIRNETDNKTIDCSAIEYVQPTGNLMFFYRGYGPYTKLPAARVYYLKIWSGDTLVRDYIPCLDANDVPCFYDAVNGTTLYATPTGKPPFDYLLA